jgi:hypothetical protein
MNRAALCLLLLSALALAGDKLPPPTQCTDELEDCKENCAMEFGTSQKTRNKFYGCMGKCGTANTDCRERYFETHRNGLAPDALEKKSGPPVEPPARITLKEEGAATTAAPVSKVEEEPVPKRTATRVSEMGGPPPKAQAASPEPEVPAVKQTVTGPAEVRPEQATKRRDPEKPAAPAPEKKKRALDEWDPDAL